ncbi:hypothetical protein AUEXF2481DRAFT_234693 [Aureobasidium subglaciale EXF-2481]|uniref:Uncharacterized protein n=1 Tax=Aureobasidium subglaciale (strain EXF-2481) TaxID=1043005 RepID=A0A074YBC3_AURSE|nr:uncharacterized protein AUEXF2481DRAFT_234693 [Aureobasidium subglaciale EXF-2481]KEQ95088.1 hypothetical protein AUEXF2481DRAFT_234693 [Aureobasidium subglaciale EXF-2481]
MILARSCVLCSFMLTIFVKQLLFWGISVARHEHHRDSLPPLLPGEGKCNSCRISHKAVVIILSIALTASLPSFPTPSMVSFETCYTI